MFTEMAFGQKKDDKNVSFNCLLTDIITVTSLIPVAVLCAAQVSTSKTFTAYSQVVKTK